MSFETESDIPSSPTGGRRLSRRQVVLGVSVAATALAGGGFMVARSRAAARREQAAALASQTYERLRAGAIGAAVKLATDARLVDPTSREPAYAWLHATGISLLDDAGGAKEAIGFIDEARRLGAAGTDIAFCMLVGAVAMKNDKLAERLVRQHDDQRVPPDAWFLFAQGAARDLFCARDAAEAYEASAALWADAVLPRLRAARAHLVRGRLAEARDAVSALPDDSTGKRVILAAAARLASRRAEPPPFGSAALDEAPRSLRPLGLALLVQADDPSAAIDAAIDDIDSPLVAVTCGRLALYGGDVTSAETAAAAARRMRPESPEVAGFSIQLALARGDLERAKSLASESADAASVALVSAIEAYEDKSPERIREAVESAMDNGVSPWRVANEARGVLGDGPSPDIAAPKGSNPPPLWVALEAGEPWADVVLFDAAFAAGDTRTCNAVVDCWRELTKAREKRRRLLLGKADIR